MIGAITFDFPQGWLLAIPAVLGVAFAIWRQHKAGLRRSRMALLAALRAAVLALLVFLAARPVWIAREPPAAASRAAVVLLDRSESMALEEQQGSRYQEAFDFVRDSLLPELRDAGLPVQAMLFDQSAEPADGDKLANATPDGKRTNPGNAIAQAFATTAQPPLAVIALTDGAATDSADNTRALTALVDSGVPFIGVGFGSDLGVRTLSLRELDAPPTVAPKTTFSVSAQLEAINVEELPSFDLLLFRDGQLAQQKKVASRKGSRLWLENFQLSEDQPGAHNYSVQLLPPTLPHLKCVNTTANIAVRISEEKELRVLYIQGALTWDYKFINLALRNDPTMKLTGLTRTSKQSVFRQNVESAGELMSGFPTTLQELAPYRVVVLSNLRPSDLTIPQQDVLARFCGELGGGVLMIGGAATFDGSWQGSRLEQLLPVVFANNSGVQGLDRPFRIQLSDEALQHAVFQIGDNRSTRELWAQLPTFTQYGRVDAAKPGAQVWISHQSDDGPRGKRILMATQRYGAGLSAVLCIQNFWRWRLARDSETQQFDRFWRQLFRFLSEVGRQEVSIHLADQELRPQSDIQIVLEKQPNPKNVTETSRPFFVRVENGQKAVVREESVQLQPLRPVEMKFPAAKADVYTVTVLDSVKVPVANRAIEVRESNLEFQNTARNMETLRQWASVSDGLAMKIEDCRDATTLVGEIKAKIEQVKRGKQLRRPVGINPLTLAFLVGCLGAEWVLRKKWGLV